MLDWTKLKSGSDVRGTALGRMRCSQSMWHSAWEWLLPRYVAQKESKPVDTDYHRVGS